MENFYLSSDLFKGIPELFIVPRRFDSLFDRESVSKAH